MFLQGSKEALSLGRPSRSPFTSDAADPALRVEVNRTFLPVITCLPAQSQAQRLVQHAYIQYSYYIVQYGKILIIQMRVCMREMRGIIIEIRGYDE